MRNEKGFTLIELLVVVAIIGILAAIAIPQFAEYKIRAFNGRSETDIRNSATAQEAYFVDNEAYGTCATAAACEAALPGFQGSAGVTMSSTAGAGGDDFTSAGTHPDGDTTYTYDSSAGGMQ